MTDGVITIGMREQVQIGSIVPYIRIGGEWKDQPCRAVAEGTFDEWVASHERVLGVTPSESDKADARGAYFYGVVTD